MFYLLSWIYVFSILTLSTRFTILVYLGEPRFQTQIWSILRSNPCLCCSDQHSFCTNIEDELIFLAYCWLYLLPEFGDLNYFTFDWLLIPICCSFAFHVYFKYKPITSVPDFLPRHNAYLMVLMGDQQFLPIGS